MAWLNYLLIAAGAIPCVIGIAFIVYGLKAYRSDESVEHNVRGNRWFLANMLFAGLGRIGMGTWIAALTFGMPSMAWLLASAALMLLRHFLPRGSLAMMRGKRDGPT
ncbi:MAG TPA: hypothetical protein VFM39_06470 [bacterium]|nr:hypothetical protein [bacterium]